MASILYLAYGSNLHPLRLAGRVPSARLLGVVRMPGYRLAFHKRSVDGSGKCLVYAERSERRRVYGAQYEFDAEEKAGLYAADGRGYREQTVCCRQNGKTCTPFTYLARATHIDPRLLPYHWYKHLLLAGAHHHGFPADCLASIAATPSMDDPDTERSRENENLLERLGWT